MMLRTVKPNIHIHSEIMGQRPSKRVSSSSTQTLLTNRSNPTPTPSTPSTLQGTITPPSKPQELTRLSEIIDPRELLNDEIYNVTPTRPKAPPHSLTIPKSLGLQPLINPDSPRTPPTIVHSPSGNALDTDEFMRHPGRPLAIWERQERVIKRTMEEVERYEAESRAGMRSRLGARSRTGAVREDQGKRRGGWCCGCFCI